MDDGTNFGRMGKITSRRRKESVDRTSGSLVWRMHWQQTLRLSLSREAGALRYRLPIFVLPCPDYAIRREGTSFGDGDGDSNRDRSEGRSRSRSSGDAWDVDLEGRSRGGKAGRRIGIGVTSGLGLTSLPPGVRGQDIVGVAEIGTSKLS